MCKTSLTASLDMSSIQANGAAEAEADIDPLQYRPNPDALVSKVAAAKDSDQTAQDGLYRPPRLNPVAMEDDPDKEYHRREKRAAADKARRLAQSDLVKDLTRELADAPEEVTPSHLQVACMQPIELEVKQCQTGYYHR